MKLAISNIAWPTTAEPAVAQLLQDMKITGVEVAPTAVWPSPLMVTDGEIRSYREFWHSHGIRIVAMQALLFGRTDLTVFENPRTRRETLAYLSEMISLGRKLGADVLVFGSPKNRKTNDLSQLAIERIAVSFFRELGEVAAKNGVYFCIEPNPKEYDCDFVTTSEQGLELVGKVGSKGFGLHLDAGAMTLGGEHIESGIERSIDVLRHFHISEPQLARIGTGGVDHKSFAKALTRLGYKNWVSVEMKTQNQGSCLDHVATAMRVSLDSYFAES